MGERISLSNASSGPKKIMRSPIDEERKQRGRDALKNPVGKGITETKVGKNNDK